MQNKLSPILAVRGARALSRNGGERSEPNPGARHDRACRRTDLCGEARDGTELKVTLADNAQVTALTKASLNDIKQGSFVGVTASRRPTAANARSRCTSFPKPCVGPVKAIGRGISRRTAP